MKIPIKDLKTCPINEEIYKSSSVDDLIQSIGEVGLLQNLVVRSDRTIISGHRRFKACKELGWDSVNCETKDIPDDEVDLFIVLYNQGRTKVATEILREIKILYQKLWVGRGKRDRGGGRNPHIREVVAKKVGISSGSVQMLLFVEEYKPELLAVIDKGDMTIFGAYTETKRNMNFISISDAVYERKKDIPSSIDNLTLYNSSCEQMAEVPDKSIHTIITSPPYYQKRSYQAEGQIGLEKSVDEYLSRMMCVINECKRVLKDDGCFFLIIGDSYDPNGCLRQVPSRLSLMMTNEEWILRNTLVWHKSNAKPENGSIRRWGTSYELIFFFTLGMKYQFAMNEVRQPFTEDYSKSLTSGTPRHHKIDGEISIRQHTFIRHPRGKVPKDFIDEDVLKTTHNQRADKYVPDKNLEHSATFPTKLVLPFIMATTKVGDTILDPFIGTGTTASAALSVGRKCVGYEINSVFVDQVYERCSEISQDEGKKLGQIWPISKTKTKKKLAIPSS